VPRIVEELQPSRPAYFWGLMANTLALCFAIISWQVCLHVFGHPEISRNYEILGKLGRSPVLKRYTVLDVPNGSALAPKELYKRYFGYTEEQRVRANSLLMRNYLTNFDRPLLLNYIEGDYQIGKIRKLSQKDFFDPGIVIRAQAEVASSFKSGDILSVKKSPNCAAVVHVSKINHEDELALLLTVIPIAYGSYQIGGSESFKIEPPLKLRPAAGFPIMKN
jgi:hypothetical protein